MLGMNHRDTEARRKKSFHTASDLLLLLLLVVLAGCAGNGNGLDENGNPVGSGGQLPVSFPPTYANIQTNVFSSICIACHVGASAPQGLRLDDANAYNLLVGVPSTERPDLLRVNPGNPDASYIIRKLEGGPDIFGNQMPLNRTPLPQPTINAIRVWIKNGAPR